MIFKIWILIGIAISILLAGVSGWEREWGKGTFFLLFALLIVSLYAVSR
jgi:hypothetical protein